VLNKEGSNCNHKVKGAYMQCSTESLLAWRELLGGMVALHAFLQSHSTRLDGELEESMQRHGPFQQPLSRSGGFDCCTAL
jgi:hypothetical protein